MCFQIKRKEWNSHKLYSLIVASMLLIVVSDRSRQKKVAVSFVGVDIACSLE